MDRKQKRLRQRAYLVKHFGTRIRGIKNNIVDEYGKEPSIEFYYYSCNPIKYAGEENVRASLESLCDQGKILIGDYGSTDGIHKLAKEYGAKVLDVEITPGVFFHESKIANKIMFEAKANFMFYSNFNIVYPKDIKDFCRKWLRTNNIKTHILKLIGDIYLEDGSISQYCPSCVSSLIYRPYLLYARGYDESTAYHLGTSEYAIWLLMDFFRLIWDTRWFDMKHRFYRHEDKVRHIASEKRLNNLHNKPEKNIENITDHIIYLFRQFERKGYPFKNVRNSYW